MKFLKSVALSLLSFLVFLSLAIFGLAFMVDRTVLNPAFVTSELHRLDIPSLAEEFIDTKAPREESKLDKVTRETIPEIEPVVKEEAGIAIYSVYDYLLGKKTEPGLKATLGDTFLNPDFVGSILDNLDLSLLLEGLFPEQPAQEEFTKQLAEAIINTVSEHEAAFKQKFVDAADPIFDYLLGKTADIDLATALRSTVLTSDTVLPLIDEMSIAHLVSESLGTEFTEEIPEEMAFLADHVDELMPEVSADIEKQISANIDQLLDYLVGQRQTINIEISLRHTGQILENSLREHLRDMPPHILKPRMQEILTERVTQLLPTEVSYLVEPAITDEWIDQQTEIVLRPALSYMLGESPSLSITISLEPVLTNLKERFRQEFIESPPPELAGLKSSVIEKHFDDYYQELMQGVPSTIVFDEDMLGADLPAQIDEFFNDLAQGIPSSFNIGEMLAEVIPANQITDALAEAEGKLADVRQNVDKTIIEAEDTLRLARQYIAYFQLGYKLLIAFVLLLIIAIILIDREVKATTRRLGIPLFIYGAIEYAGIIVGKNFLSGGKLPLSDLPPYLQTWMFQFIDNLIRPLEIFSLGLLVGGVVLIIISFVYPRRRSLA